MRGVRLDHATVNTDRLSETIAFYKHFLDLTPGWRPDFGFPGAWLYPADGDYAIVHLIEAPRARTKLTCSPEKLTTSTFE